MAGSFYNNNNDSMDISELASLNVDISEDLIDQLQSQLTKNISDNFDVPTVNENDDSVLFEETNAATEPTPPNNGTTKITEDADNISESFANDNLVQKEEDSESYKKEEISVNKNFDDNFIKKYKAKLNKKANAVEAQTDTESIPSEPAQNENKESIETLSQGNITEKPLTQELKDYNDSLDFLDGNVKYSKYVIYIEPQNVDFIDGLTVKERKNLINGILRQQDDIAITKQRFKVIRTVIMQIIVALLTISITIPVVYYVINASLEATIDNHRRSQTNWQTLYREHGKITQQ